MNLGRWKASDSKASPAVLDAGWVTPRALSNTQGLHLQCQ